MKYYIIINDSLKMSKGKIARVCATAGMRYLECSDVWSRIKWKLNSYTTVILRSVTKDNEQVFEQINKHLLFTEIPHVRHVDAGKTQVAPGSVCMVAFFSKGDDDKDFVEKLKLY